MALRYVLLLTSVASFAAGVGREEFRPEDARDPRIQREGLARSRGNVRELRATQLQMRIELARILAAKRAEKAKLKSADEESAAAGAIAKAQAPLKAKPKIKQLAKVVSGKQNPHDVRAAVPEEEAPQIPEDAYFEVFNVWLKRYPSGEKFRTAPMECKDLGESSVHEVDLGNDESVQEALAKVGSQPNVGYFIEQAFEQRRTALLDYAYPINEDNIRSWKRIAVYDPHPAVRLAAAQRLQRARLQRVGELLKGLKPAERDYFAKRDPYEDVTVDMLRIFAQGQQMQNVDLPGPNGRDVSVGMLFPTQGIVDVSKAILQEFGEQGGDGDVIAKEVDALADAAQARAERLAKPLELTDEDRVTEEPETVETKSGASDDSEVPEEKRAEPKDHPNVLYSVKQTPMEQLTALEDRSVPSNHENWKSWLEIAHSSAPEALRRAALLRAIEASPTYEVTKNFPEIYRELFVEYDPRHVATDFRAILALAKSETYFRHVDRANGGEVVQIALAILKLVPYPDLAETLEDRFWIELMESRTPERFMRNFDDLDFSSSEKLAEGLKELSQENQNDEVRRWAFYLLYVVATPPEAGSAQALSLKHIKNLEFEYRGKAAQYLLGLKTDAEVRQAVEEAVQQRHTWGAEMKIMFQALKSDLDYRAEHAGENLDVVAKADAKVPKLAGEPEAFPEIDYDPAGALESRSLAVGEHEVLAIDVLAKGALVKWLKIADFDSSAIVRGQARAKIWAYEKPAMERFVDEVKNQDDGTHGGALETLLVNSPRDPVTHAALKEYRDRLESEHVEQHLVFAIDQILITYPAYTTP